MSLKGVEDETVEIKYLKMCKKKGDTEEENAGSSSGTDVKTHQIQRSFVPKICL